MAVMIAGRQFWLWRAVDDEGEVIDLLVQRIRDKAAAMKLMRSRSKSSRPMCELDPLVGPRGVGFKV
jgi:transposase-like protein